MTVIFIRPRGYAADLADNFNTSTDDLLGNVGADRILWRWNSTVNFPANRLEVNTRAACALASNKPAVRRLCSGGNIRIPRTYYSLADARNHFVASSEPLLWRPHSHYGGQNMVVVNNAAEVVDQQDGGYWSLILNKSNEYRVYCLFGKVIGVDEKIVDDPTQLAWNHAQGGRFVVKHWDQWPSVACWMSTRLAAAMNLHFGAFDLIKADHHFYMLEVNTSPSMTTVYKVNLLHRAVEWVDSQVTALGNHLPSFFVPLPEAIKGYRNYIHPLHNGRPESEGS